MEINGQQISYIDKGEKSKKAIIFLHGFVLDKEMWNGFLTPLSKHFRVVAMDLPGHGKTDVFPEMQSIDKIADIVYLVLEELGIKEYFLVGHSMGGYVALSFAKKHHILTKGVVLFHSHAAEDSLEKKKKRARTASLVIKNSKNFINKFLKNLFAPINQKLYSEYITKLIHRSENMPREAIVHALRSMMEREDKLKFISQTNIPFLFIYGKQDETITYEEIVVQAMLPKKSEILILDDCGHMGFIEQEETTREAVLHFAFRCFQKG